MTKQDTGHTADMILEYVDDVRGNVAFDEATKSVIVVPGIHAAADHGVLKIPYDELGRDELVLARRIFGNRVTRYTEQQIRDQRNEDEAKPIVLVIVPHYWGTGSTLTEAWQRVRRESGKPRSFWTRGRGRWAAYAGYNTRYGNVHVDEMGTVYCDPLYPLIKVDGSPEKTDA